MGYLMMTGYESWDIAILLAGPEFRVYTVRPDAEAFESLLAGIQTFWRYVEIDMPPPAITLSDAARRWPLSTESRVIALVEQVEAARELRELRTRIAVMEKEAEMRELAIKTFLGNADLLVDGDGRKLCTWRTEHRKTLDTARFKTEQPDIAAKYVRETESRVFRLVKEK
jgi:predicted phage-related endonuclease